MNAIIPAPTRDEERNARHRRNCQRIAELAMMLTEAAAARALTQLETEPPAEPETPADPAAPRRPTNPTLTFVRLASAARQAMAHEARIDAAEDAAKAGTPFQHHFPAGEDLRAPVLAPIIRQAVAAQPNRPGIAERAAELELLDTLILIDIHGTQTAAKILETICRDCGLHPDYTRLPPELLDALFPEGPPLSATIWRPPDD